MTESIPAVCFIVLLNREGTALESLAFDARFLVEGVVPEIVAEVGELTVAAGIANLKVDPWRNEVMWSVGETRY